MNSADIPFQTVAALGDAIRTGEVSPVQVAEAYLARIGALNGEIRAYLTVTGELAMQQAREAEEEIANGNYRGPLHGIPVAVKDQMYTEGVRTTGGSRVFDEFIPEYDATVIARLKEAGAVLLGKLNMTEFATTGLSHQYDPPRNPWGRDRSCGGSSSGSGAAPAAFMCAAALGEDTGGSVRFPAAWCGLAGLRPTYGRVSRYGLMPGVRSMDTVGPLAHTVEDCAIVMQAIAGHDPKDRLTSQEPPPDFRAALTGNVEGLRIGILREVLYADSVEPDVGEAVIEAGNVLSRLGAEVHEVSIPITANAGTISSGMRVEAPTTYQNLLRERPRELGHDNRIGYLVNSIMPATYYYKALRLRTHLRGRSSGLWRTWTCCCFRRQAYRPSRWRLIRRSPARTAPTALRGCTPPRPAWPTSRPWPCRAGSATRGCPSAFRSQDAPSTRPLCCEPATPMSKQPTGTRAARRCSGVPVRARHGHQSWPGGIDSPGHPQLNSPLFR